MSSEHSSHTDEALLPGLLAAERMLWCRGVVHVAGIDEAGRGPLAGPVVAAAALFPHDLVLEGVRDSKVLREHKREEAYAEILRHALSVGVGIVEPEVIDDINILNATFRAMRMAVDRLRLRPDHLLVDGNRYPAADIPVTTIVGGDASSFTIAAASIVAKVTRDRLMRDYDQRYPGYGFARNKGYGTQEHRDAIERLGLSPIHRRSFVLHSSGEGADHAHRSGRGAPGPGVPHAAGVPHSRDEFPFPSRRD